MRYRALLILFLAVFIWPVMSEAGTPHWSFSLKGGYFMPNVDGWKDHYGSEGAATGGIELGWKITRQLELSGDIGYFGDSGKAVTAVSGVQSIDTIYHNQVPINISLLFRLVFSNNQIVVPYVGGGYTHIFYWQKLNNNTVSGDQNGYHIRGGLQFLLDPIEPEAAEDMATIWGVDNTYFFIEGHYSKVDDFGSADYDIGGLSILGGFLLEF